MMQENLVMAVLVQAIQTYPCFMHTVIDGEMVPREIAQEISRENFVMVICCM
jgi:DNA repair protein RadC